MLMILDSVIVTSDLDGASVHLNIYRVVCIKCILQIGSDSALSFRQALVISPDSQITQKAVYLILKWLLFEKLQPFFIGC